MENTRAKPVVESQPKTLCICVSDTFIEAEEGGGSAPVPAPSPAPIVSPYMEEEIPTTSLARGPTFRFNRLTSNTVAAH